VSTLAIECPIIVIIEDGIYGGFTIETTLFARLRSGRELEYRARSTIFGNS
jgi:hypothetical protein